MKLKKRPKVGLALGSGGTRGLTIIGVLEVLQKYQIHIDYIAGSSTGAVFGGAYAKEKNLDKMKEIARSVQSKDFLSSVSDLGNKKGLVRGNKFLDKIKTYTGDIKIEELQIPFVAVTTNNATGNPVILNKGSLADAMRASSSVPVLFEPFEDSSSNELIDGGLTQAVPVEAVKQMGADIVIAVNLYEHALHYKPKSKVSTMQHYLLLLLKNLASKDCQGADVTISPKFETVNWAKDLNNREQLFAEGIRATEEKIDEILIKIKPLLHIKTTLNDLNK